VGLVNGKWSDATNWITTNDGVGGAGMPTASDNVIFVKNNSRSTINIDVSTNINSLQISGSGPISLTLYVLEMNTLQLRLNTSWDLSMSSGTIDNVRNMVTLRMAAVFKGSFDGHGYYESIDKYNWPDANDAVTQLKGNLVTINSAAENTFISTNINQHENYASIGLTNTGKQGGFAWVTGEPLDFTNWLPGQPDNLYGMNNPDTTIFEPYVHVNGFYSLNRWNDNGAGTVARILAEFDHPVLTYRQISGPNNGDSSSAGTYTVCYEKTNKTTGIIDTCCCNITVICQPTNSTNESLQQANTLQVSQNFFSAKVITNPSTTSFTIKINSDNFKEKVRVEVTDASGRMIDRKSNIMIGKAFQLGSGYTTGIYFARISQGVNFTVLKLVKK